MIYDLIDLIDAKDMMQDDPRQAQGFAIDMIDERDMDHEEDPDPWLLEVEAIEADLSRMSSQDLSARIWATHKVATKVQSSAGGLQWICIGSSDQGADWVSYCGQYWIVQDGNKYYLSTPRGSRWVKFGRVAFWIPEFHWQWNHSHRNDESTMTSYEDAESRCFAWVFHGMHSEDEDDMELMLEWIAANP